MVCVRELAAGHHLHKVAHHPTAGDPRWAHFLHERTATATVREVLLNKCNDVLRLREMISENSATSCFTTTYPKDKSRKLPTEATTCLATRILL